jgi:hypothetical protein
MDVVVCPTGREHLDAQGAPGGGKVIPESRRDFTGQVLPAFLGGEDAVEQVGVE